MSYNRSKYFTTLSKKKIKYLFIKRKSQIIVVFFHGLLSNMIGSKPKSIQSFCKKQKLSFLKFEYSGHGKSTGQFTKGNITQWTNDARQLIKSKIKKNDILVFIGSSMGSWIALNLLMVFKKRMKGFVGIASAPEFLEELMWKKFNKNIKKEIMSKKIYYLNHGGFVYPITKQLIVDGRKNKVLNKKISINMSITLFHGLKDQVVPFKFSKNLLKIFKKSKKKLVTIKNGNHSLSRKSDLKKICKELKLIILNCQKDFIY